MSMLLTAAFADNYETADEHLVRIHTQVFMLPVGYPFLKVMQDILLLQYISSNEKIS